MKSIVVAAALLLAAPAFAQNYPGDDDSYDDQHPPAQPPPQQQGGIDYGYGNTADQPPPQQQPYGQPPPQPQTDPVFRQPPMPPPAASQQGPTYEDFRDDPSLQANGFWVESPEYGTVWRPTRVSPGWQPYLYGRWAWTDAGWAWISEEPFGWATYHYGRWAVLDDGGWAWLPGRVWAPAWVAWRYDEGFAAWCPLGPRGYVYEQPREWVAVDNRHFLEPVRSYLVPVQRRQEIIVRAPVYRGARYGPQPVVIGRATGTVVRPLVIRDGGARHTEVNGGSVQFFRPHTAPVVVNRQPNRPAEVSRPQPRPVEPNRPAEGDHRYVPPQGNPHRPEVTTQQPSREAGQPPREAAQPPRQVGQPPRQVGQAPREQPPHPAQPQPPPRVFTAPTRTVTQPPQQQRPGTPSPQKQPPPRPAERHEEK
jgi:hypothetical protein